MQTLTVPILVALAGTIIATATDIKWREVPDWLSYALVALGILFAFTADYVHGTLHPLWGAACAMVSLLIVVLAFDVSEQLSKKINAWPAWATYAINALAIIAGSIVASMAYRHTPLVGAATFGVVVGYTVGAMLYFAGQWGGGDAKLLIGLGALITFPPTIAGISISSILQGEAAWPTLLIFLGWLLVCGAVYGLVWMLVLIAMNWKRFKSPFHQALKAKRWLRWTILSADAILLALCIVWMLRAQWAIASLTLLLALVLYGAFYLSVAVRVAEEQFMRKRVLPIQLTEGDWVLDGAKVGSRWIIPKDNLGATNEQIAQLQKIAPKLTVTIKEGIPFVPSFLAALLILFL